MKTKITLLLLIAGLASVSGQDSLREDSLIMEFWDETKEEWSLFGKTENTFDVNGQLTTAIFYFADEGNFVPIEKTEYDYDNDGNRTRSTEYEDEGGTGEWTVSDKYEYFPDASGKDTTELGYDWDSDAQSWNLESKSEFTYDASGNLIQTIDYRTEGVDKPWIPKWKHEKDYDSNGNDTLLTTYRWNETSEQWDPSERIAQTHDEDGNVILHYHEYWDEDTNQWEFQDREKYEIVVTDYTKQEVAYEWDESGNKWDPIYRLTYYHSDPVTSINNAGSAAVRVYPNPATEFIVFDGIETPGTAYVEIFEIHGKIVLSQPIDNSQKVSVRHLSHGLYLYRYSVVSKTYTGKLIIK
jgi:hypothetical protein